MARLAVKLLLLDADDRLLLIHAKDPKSHAECWYPVGGGVESGESLQMAAQHAGHADIIRELIDDEPSWRDRRTMIQQAADVYR
jgi:8-oxo-dGTP pyrophosphatase MutT (NUDIX family)